MRSKFTATALLFTTAIIWGFAFVAQVLGSDHVGTFTFNGIRFMLGAASLIPIYCIFEKERDITSVERKARHKHTAIGALCGGLCLFIASALQQYGATLTRDPAKAGFITGLYTVLTPVLYLLIFRRKTGWNTWLGCILATVGLYLLCLREGQGGSFGLGEIVLLIGSFFWAGHILIVDRFIDRVSPLRFSSWQFFISGALGLIAALIFEDITWNGVWSAKWAILFCGFLSVGVAYTLQMFGQKYSDPTYAAIIFSTESVFAAVGGLLWNLITPESIHVDQDILPIGYLGCIIIFAGIVLSQLNFSKKKQVSKT